MDPRIASELSVPDLPGYRDVTLISHGSTSLVFRAVQSRLGRSVAIKVLLVDDDLASHNDYRRELETTVLLSGQPHIVGIIDTGTTGTGNPYIVMEYCPGGSYGQILKQRGPLPVDEVVDVGAKIAQALQAAHDVGVLHRDVKPSNILRSAFGPALADFGIARAPHQLSGTSSLDRLTPHHASPEAMRKDAQSPVSDLYSLASTLWHLLAGRPPFADQAHAGQSLEELRERLLNEPAGPVPRPDVPDWLQRELLRALSKDPRQRHPSAHTFAEILNYQAYREHGAGAAPVPQPPVAPMPSVPPVSSAPPVSTPPMSSAPPVSSAPPGPPPAPTIPPVPTMPPASGMPVGGWPTAPAGVPRDAFRWPQSAPTRRNDFEPPKTAPVLDTAAMEAAAASTITWKERPSAEAERSGTARDGTARDGAAPDSSAQDSSAQESSAQESSAQENSADSSGRGSFGQDGAGQDNGGQAGAPTSTTPFSAAPVSAAPVSGASVPGASVSGASVPAAPAFAAPTSTAPVSAAPAVAGPTPVPPTSGVPTSGIPASVPPTSGVPASAGPASAWTLPTEVRPTVTPQRTFVAPDRPGAAPNQPRPDQFAPAQPSPPGYPPANGGAPVPGRPIPGYQATPPSAPSSAPPAAPSSAPPSAPHSYQSPPPPTGPPTYHPGVRQPPVLDDRARSGRQSLARRGWLPIAYAAGSVLMLVAVVVVIIVLHGNSSGTGPPAAHGSGDPAATGTLQMTKRNAPANVKLTDNRTSVTLTWTDPSGGTAPIVVLGGPRDTEPKLLQDLSPGTVTFTQMGVNAAVDYCYIVGAVYGADGPDMFARSAQVCTHRFG